MTKDINKTEFSDETKLKLDIFRKCFREWYPVFVYNKYTTKLFIFDMFAGSGQDARGCPGSPLILLQEARGDKNNIVSSSEIKEQNKYLLFSMKKIYPNQKN